ncbi:MAG: hypothetical protein AAF108_09980 [Planctomycetota bacterium]
MTASRPSAAAIAATLTLAACLPQAGCGSTPPPGGSPTGPGSSAAAPAPVGDEPEAEPRPVPAVDPTPPWFVPEVATTGVGTVLVPGFADAAVLLDARDAALKAARTNAAEAGLIDTDYDEDVLHARAARLSTGEHRYWVVLELTPSN